MLLFCHETPKVRIILCSNHSVVVILLLFVDHPLSDSSVVLLPCHCHVCCSCVWMCLLDILLQGECSHDLLEII